MIELEGLTKSFAGADGKPVFAAEDVSFSVKPGEVFGLLGPNGAGKTTTLRILCTVLKPTAGFASVAGFDVATHIPSFQSTVRVQVHADIEVLVPDWTRLRGGLSPIGSVTI